MTDLEAVAHRRVRFVRSGVGALCLLLLAAPLAAQDLDPRAYANVPVNATFLVWGFSVSHGGVVTDPTLPVTDINATVETPSVGVGRSFSLFGQTAQAFGVLPCSWAQMSGKALGEARSTTRAGLSDMRLRLSVLVRGAPAASVAEFAKAPRRTILGTSLTVVGPTGQFFPDKLVNLGANRWAFKPEFAVSQPMGQKWLLDVYTGLWLFAENDAFYPGTSLRAQAPMGVIQTHLSYSIRRQLWAAFDATYYAGGRSTIQGVDSDDRQSNSRLGVTLVLPVGRRHSLKLAASRGAIVRSGANFTTLLRRVADGVVTAPCTCPIGRTGKDVDRTLMRHLRNGTFSLATPVAPRGRVPPVSAACPADPGRLLVVDRAPCGRAEHDLSVRLPFVGDPCSRRKRESSRLLRHKPSLATGPRVHDSRGG